MEMISRFVLWLFQLMFFAWTAPRTWVAGEVVTAAVCNVHIRDQFSYLKDAPTLTGVATISGLNVGSATGAGAGDVYGSGELQMAGTGTHYVGGAFAVGTATPVSGSKLCVAGGLIAISALSATVASSAAFDFADGARFFSMGGSGSTKGTFAWIGKGADDSSTTVMTIDTGGNMWVVADCSALTFTDRP